MDLLVSMKTLYDFQHGKVALSHDIVRTVLISFEYVGTSPFSDEEKGEESKRIWLSSVTLEWIDLLLDLAANPPKEDSQGAFWDYHLFMLFNRIAQILPVMTMEKILARTPSSRNTRPFERMLVVLFGDGDEEPFEWLNLILNQVENLPDEKLSRFVELLGQIKLAVPVETDVNEILLQLYTHPLLAENQKLKQEIKPLIDFQAK